MLLLSYEYDKIVLGDSRVAGIKVETLAYSLILWICLGGYP